MGRPRPGPAIQAVGREVGTAPPGTAAAADLPARRAAAHCRPSSSSVAIVAADAAQPAAQVVADFNARRRRAGSQQQRHGESRCGVVDMDRPETAYVFMAVEPRQLLMAVHDIDRVVYVHHDRTGRSPTSAMNRFCTGSACAIANSRAQESQCQGVKRAHWLPSTCLAIPFTLHHVGMVAAQASMLFVIFHR